jgi:TPP-dependent pyruvate/acetoin dehydrogenase alpha subunit
MIAKFYESLYRIRRVEEEIAKVYPTDKIKSPVHLSIGQEAVAVGVCEALRADDIVFITYRSHAGYIAKGGNLKGMIAELYGKVTGSAKGKGGSMHLVDVPNGVMGASAVVGTTIANSIGYAYGVKLKKQDNLVVCFFGDGSTDEGVFYESLNFAALKKLPIIFVCENNGYAIHTSQAKRQSMPDIAVKVASFGIPVERIEDDVLYLHNRISQAVAKIRSGQTGPFFFECATYRWKEHVGPSEDYNAGYRPHSEAEPWMAKDQVQRLANMLPAHQRKTIEARVEIEILEAFEFAEKSAFPPEVELYEGVFA